MATDQVDGWLARRWNQTSQLGKLLDPIADKVLVMAALVMLVGQHVAPAWMVALIIVREIAVSGLRLAAIERGIVMAARDLGKLKTWAQAIAAGVGGFAASSARGATTWPGGSCCSRSSSPGSRGSTTPGSRRRVLRGTS